MNKKMTPCEKLGYKVGDKFEFVGTEHFKFNAGDLLTLIRDDGSRSLLFSSESGAAYVYLEKVRKVSALKPAKQALADAIHQNGGWRDQANYAVQSGFNLRIHFTDDDKKPVISADRGWHCRTGFMFFGSTSPLKAKLPNWHQCILSREEYFTAYPEQVVNVEMKSESEMTTKVSDWHKNGELPPVGEVCEIQHKCWNKDHFDVVTILAKTVEYVIVGYSTFEQHYSIKDVSFIPLKTAREKAIDEIVLLANSIGWNSEKSNEIIIDVAGAIYDAGMYNEVK